MPKIPATYVTGRQQVTGIYKEPSKAKKKKKINRTRRKNGNSKEKSQWMMDIRKEVQPYYT
jgi:hypothetical protein